MERQEEKSIWLSFSLLPCFPLKFTSHIPLSYFFFWEFALTPVSCIFRYLLNRKNAWFPNQLHNSSISILQEPVQTHPIRVYTIDLAKLLEHPLRSPDKWRGAFKLLHLCNRCLSWFLVCHWTHRKTYNWNGLCDSGTCCFLHLSVAVLPVYFLQCLTKQIHVTDSDSRMHYFSRITYWKAYSLLPEW